MCGGRPENNGDEYGSWPMQPYSEDEPPPDDDDDEVRFKWRLDPEETFSDWKIEVVTSAEDGNNDQKRDAGSSSCWNIVKTYHVHKNYLAVGKRKSEYFARLFRNADKFKESKDSTSRIELDPLAASSFPALLDYIYAPDRPLEIKTETATALHYLGEYFEMRHLRYDAKHFCKRDLSLVNVETYYQHANQLQNDSILGTLAEFLGKNIQEVDLASSIMQKSDPQLWVHASKAVDPKCADHWSQVVNRVASAHGDTLEKTMFQELTETSTMPRVHETVALDLCKLEDKVLASGDSSESDHPNPDLSSLQERCASSLADIWKTWQASDEDTLETLKNRKASFLVDLLVKVLDKSQEEIHETNEELRKATKSIRNFKLLPTGIDYLVNGSSPVPQHVIDIKPDLTGGHCKQCRVYCHGYRDFPVFYYTPNP